MRAASCPRALVQTARRPRTLLWPAARLLPAGLRGRRLSKQHSRERLRDRRFYAAAAMRKPGERYALGLVLWGARLPAGARGGAAGGTLSRARVRSREGVAARFTPQGLGGPFRVI